MLFKITSIITTMKQNTIIVIYLMGLVSLISCNPNEETAGLVKQNIQYPDSSNIIVNQEEETPASIEIEEFLINQKISWKSKLEDLKNNFQIDSIVPVPEDMELSDADKLVYIGETYFEYFEKRNYCELGIVVFDDRIKEVELNGIQLTNNTTLEILATHFSDCENPREISIHNDETIYEVCRVESENIDMSLYFFFVKNKLKRIDVWYPS